MTHFGGQKWAKNGVQIWPKKGAIFGPKNGQKRVKNRGFGPLHDRIASETVGRGRCAHPQFNDILGAFLTPKNPKIVENHA